LAELPLFTKSHIVREFLVGELPSSSPSPSLLEAALILALFLRAFLSAADVNALLLDFFFLCEVVGLLL